MAKCKINGRNNRKISENDVETVPGSEYIDKELFKSSLEYIKNLEKGAMGIGTLSEKTMHQVLKFYYAPNPACHEIKVGNLYADIMMDGEITEIQTRAFNNLRKKFDVFLPEHEVTVVYPIPHIKYISWIDPDTGEISKPRKSGKKGNIYSVIPELYKIKMYLSQPGLHFIFPLVDVNETKLLNGYGKDRKVRAWRNDRYPTDIYSEYRINSKSDFKIFVPEGLQEEYTSADFAKEAKIGRSHASTLLGILLEVGVVERIGKKERSYLYKTVK